jgi:hypothetical protein
MSNGNRELSRLPRNTLFLRRHNPVTAFQQADFDHIAMIVPNKGFMDMGVRIMAPNSNVAKTLQSNIENVVVRVRIDEYRFHV